MQTALHKRYPACERFIANAIGVEPWEIWPSRYDTITKEPLRNHPSFPLRRKASWKKSGGRPKKDSTAPVVANGYESQGA